MHEEDTNIVVNRHIHGPIVEISNNQVQRPLYSDNEVDASPQMITKKLPSVQKIQTTSNQNPKSKKKIPLQSLPLEQTTSLLKPSQTQSKFPLKIKQPKQNYRHQRINKKQVLQNNGVESQSSHSELQVKQFKKSSKNIAMDQNATQFRHEYKNYKSKKNVSHYIFHQQMQGQQQQLHSQINYPYDRYSQKQSPKQLLKFHQSIRLKSKHPLYDQYSKDLLNGTLSNFNQQLHSLDFNKLNSIDVKNRSLRSSQGGRWLRSQSFMQENEKKITFGQNLIKNYHKHESKYWNSLQKYLQILTKFEDKLVHQPFEISLMHTLEDIKINMETYMEKIVQLQNLPIDKPTFEWTQGQLTKFFTNYEPIFLPPQSVDSITQTLTLKKYKNCVYFGQINNGKKQGKGIIYYFNGKIFQGKFEKDQKVYGFQMEEDENEFYVGQFDKGMRNGLGILKNNQFLLWGKFAKGQFTAEIQSKQGSQASMIRFKQDQKSTNKFDITSGTFTSNNRVKFIKQTSLDFPKQGFKLSFNQLIIYTQSLTILKNSTNDLYIGQFNEETKEKYGQGLEIFTNGDLYIGQYECNTPEYYGEYYWASGAYYRGEFMSGMRHGKGKWHMLHGDLYQGEYMNDKKNGKGVYLWKNGAKYVGAFENDYRHGYGQMTWNDGRTYKGEWINGIQKNVQIKLDKGIDKSIIHPGSSNGTSVTLQENKKTIDSRKSFLPGVTRRTNRSISNPNSKQSFHSIDSSHPINKKIAIQNIKALYNPSNH